MKYKLSYLLITTLLLLPSLGHADLPIIQEGKDIYVVLCNITELSSKELSRDFEEAEYGMGFAILISKKTSDEGRFMLKELRDFKVDGNSFIQQSDHKPEPQTTVNGIEEFEDLLTIWKVDQFKEKRGMMMSTRIAGDSVAEFETLSLKVTFGWGEKIESFDFEVPSGEIGLPNKEKL